MSDDWRGVARDFARTALLAVAFIVLLCGLYTLCYAIVSGRLPPWS